MASNLNIDLELCAHICTPILRFYVCNCAHHRIPALTMYQFHSLLNRSTTDSPWRRMASPAVVGGRKSLEPSSKNVPVFPHFSWFEQKDFQPALLETGAFEFGNAVNKVVWIFESLWAITIQPISINSLMKLDGDFHFYQKIIKNKIRNND